MLSRVVSDPALDTELYYVERPVKPVYSYRSRAREREAAWKASSSDRKVMEQLTSSLRAPCGVRAGAGVRRRTSWTPQGGLELQRAAGATGLAGSAVVDRSAAAAP